MSASEVSVFRVKERHALAADIRRKAPCGAMVEEEGAAKPLPVLDAELLDEFPPLFAVWLESPHRRHFSGRDDEVSGWLFVAHVDLHINDEFL